MKDLIKLVVLVVIFGAVLRFFGDYLENPLAVTTGFLIGWAFDVVYYAITKKESKS